MNITNKQTQNFAPKPPKNNLVSKIVWIPVIVVALSCLLLLTNSSSTVHAATAVTCSFGEKRVATGIENVSGSGRYTCIPDSTTAWLLDPPLELLLPAVGLLVAITVVMIIFVYKRIRNKSINKIKLKK